jgi:hypothetical protein
MNSEQAKEILASCRPGGLEDDDPRFAEALDAAQRDPQLAAWFEEQLALDAAIRRKLHETSLPDDLLNRILAAQKCGARSPARSRHGWLALAAGVMILMGLGAIWFQRGPATRETAFESFQADMPVFLRVFPTLDVETERLVEVRRWLESRQPAVTGKLPAGLELFPSIGCREVLWRNRKAALVCYMVDGEVVHLFVLNKSDWPEAALAASPRFERQGAMATAAWSEGDSVYLALSRGGEAFLKRYL